jgi:hypothetical protein
LILAHTYYIACEAKLQLQFVEKSYGEEVSGWPGIACYGKNAGIILLFYMRFFHVCNIKKLMG